jgi:hypothetical protein
LLASIGKKTHGSILAKWWWGGRDQAGEGTVEQKSAARPCRPSGRTAVVC